MFKRVALAATIAAVPLGVLAASGSAYAVTHPVKFTGSITCSVSGSITANPPITTATQTSKIVLKATLSSCTGSTSEKGVTITGGTVTAAQSVDGSCTTLISGLPAGTATVKYTANSPGASNSKIAFSGVGVGANSSGAIVFSIPNSGGTTTTTGSFANATNGSSATAVIDQSTSQLLSDCTGTGVKKLTFTGTNGASSATIG